MAVLGIMATGFGAMVGTYSDLLLWSLLVATVYITLSLFVLYESIII